MRWMGHVVGLDFVGFVVACLQALYFVEGGGGGRGVSHPLRAVIRGVDDTNSAHAP